MADHEETIPVRVFLSPSHAERLRVAAARRTKPKSKGGPSKSAVIAELIEEHLPRVDLMPAGR